MILSLLTSGPQSVIELLDDAGVSLKVDVWDSGRQLADFLLAHIENICLEFGGLRSLSGIVIMSGPGSFTSLRIGHTIANALAISLGVPVAGGIGASWQEQAVRHLKITPTGQLALPEYGSEANVTRPKA